MNQIIFWRCLLTEKKKRFVRNTLRFAHWKQNNSLFISCSAKKHQYVRNLFVRNIVFSLDVWRWILMKEKKTNQVLHWNRIFVLWYCVLYLCNIYVVAVSIRKHFITRIRVPYNESCSDYFHRFRPRSHGKYAKEKKNKRFFFYF